MSTRSSAVMHEPDTQDLSGAEASPHASASLVSALGARIRSTLGSAVPAQVDCALIDFPDHENVGDSAIWLGELAWLAESGARLRYCADVKSYARGALARALGSKGVILLHGGGNLGDLWRRHQRLREMVIRDFPDRPIVQLPQSVHFTSAEAAARAREVFDAHPRLTLFVRDETSLAFARNEFRAGVALCPDMAFCLGPIPRPVAADVDVLWLKRQDREASINGTRPTGAGIVVGDWLEERRFLVQRLHHWGRPALGRLSGRLRAVDALVRSSYAWQARHRVAAGCQLLSRGRVVITDRLHGHVLCLLLGIEHVLLDNNYGKVRRFFDAWTRSAPLAHWADSPSEAVSTARTLLAG